MEAYIDLEKRAQIRVLGPQPNPSPTHPKPDQLDIAGPVEHVRSHTGWQMRRPRLGSDRLAQERHIAPRLRDQLVLHRAPRERGDGPGAVTSLTTVLSALKSASFVV